MNKRTDGEVQAYVDGYNACFEKFRETLLQRNVGADKAIRKMETLKEAVNSVLLTENVGMCQQNVGEMSEKQIDGDLISREKVEQYLATLLSDYLYDEERMRLEKFEEWLCELPTYSVKEDTAELYWLQYDANPRIGNWHCTKCNMIVSENDPNYCPNCGRKMKEESEEEE